MDKGLQQVPTETRGAQRKGTLEGGDLWVTFSNVGSVQQRLWGSQESVLPLLQPALLSSEG